MSLTTAVKYDFHNDPVDDDNMMMKNFASFILMPNTLYLLLHNTECTRILTHKENHSENQILCQQVFFLLFPEIDYVMYLNLTFTSPVLFEQ